MQGPTAVKEQRESQKQQWQKLVSDANAIEGQGWKQEEQQQKLNLDANVPPTIHRAQWYPIGKWAATVSSFKKNRASVLQSLPWSTNPDREFPKPVCTSVPCSASVRVPTQLSLNGWNHCLLMSTNQFIRSWEVLPWFFWTRPMLPNTTALATVLPFMLQRGQSTIFAVCPIQSPFFVQADRTIIDDETFGGFTSCNW